MLYKTFNDNFFNEILFYYNVYISFNEWNVCSFQKLSDSSHLCLEICDKSEYLKNFEIMESKIKVQILKNVKNIERWIIFDFHI